MLMFRVGPKRHHLLVTHFEPLDCLIVCCKFFLNLVIYFQELAYWSASPASIEPNFPSLRTVKR
ncbi:predicted protein [Plenodomus lingam JN3]|uniref:Predicted protein n=1 Tax=Leptosphaeria maculans (strain JN3 / isolate v23.1.3 / race Av1-4-5-6-7-8) TaxID=985895 RepID=E4ZZP6_LEPMJ|nr:predicted protein [Plenodomus lingam JN3]CBX97162.1 predicted protein [Plenodomus lingam JN3]